MRISMGLLVAFGTPSVAENVAASNRYLLSANSGEAIDEGTMYLLVAIVLGVIAEIGGLIARQTNYYEIEEDERVSN